MSEEIIECQVHILGEKVPMVAEITSEGGVAFSVTNAFLRVRTTGGVQTHPNIPAHAEKVEPDKWFVYASWDTSSYEPGYYLLRFWVEMDMDHHPEDDDYMMASSELKRYLRDEGTVETF